jgi:hypothetical protein
LLTENEVSDGADLFPDDPMPPPAAPSERVAGLPWHKVRKYWVRRHQWAGLIGELIETLEFDGRPFRYLTLPGEDLLDVRLVHDECEQRKVDLRFLGFDVTRSASVNVSEHEISSLPNIHGGSQILCEQIEKVTHADSIAFERAAGFLGFDAINLDFCGNIAEQDAGTPQSNLDAISAILHLQTKRGDEPWLLFITTRCHWKKVAGSVQSSFCEILQTNFRDSEDFRTRMTAAPFQITSDHVTEFLAGKKAFSAREQCHAFGVGFGKWLIHLALDAWRVTQVLSAGYRVGVRTPAPDMLSLAFRFERVPQVLKDKHGLVPNRPASTPVNETTLVKSVLDAMQDLTDVDILLRDDHRVREAAIRENATLLSLARYDYQQALKFGRDTLWPTTPPPRSKRRRGRQ